MPASFFSPTSKNTGSALYVSFNSKEGNVFLKFVKQTSWDDKTKRGSFKDGKWLNFKLSQDETADLLRAIRNSGECSFYHTFEGNSTTGSFRYYEVERDGKKKSGFGLTVKKDSDEFKVGFTLGSAERLSEYLKFALDHIFSADYAADKKQSEEYAKNKEAKSKENPKSETKSTPTPDPVETKSEDNDDSSLF